MERLNFLNNAKYKVYMNIDTSSKIDKWENNTYSNWGAEIEKFDINSTNITIYEVEINWVDRIKNGNIPTDDNKNIVTHIEYEKNIG